MSIMISFYMCDDNEDFVKKIKKAIDNYMMNSDIDYEFRSFDNYDQKFRKAIKTNNGFRVYLLDIQTTDGSGIDAARLIREELEDWSSVIIIITAYNEYKYDALNNRLFLLDFVNKLDNCEMRLKEDLGRIMKLYDARQKCLSFEYARVAKKIEFRNIVYITKEKDSKKCIIHTEEKDYVVGKNLRRLYEELDSRFLRISRSTIINLEQVQTYDKKENVISFSNGFKTYDIPRDMKKEVLKSVGIR